MSGILDRPRWRKGVRITQRKSQNNGVDTKRSQNKGARSGIMDRRYCRNSKENKGVRGEHRTTKRRKPDFERSPNS